jgi:hypothetical protein
MKKILITTAAMALALSIPPLATADSNTANGPGTALATDKAEAKVNTDNSTKTVDVTKKVDVDIAKAKDSYNTKKIDVDIAKAKDSYNTKTDFDLTLKNAFNKTTLVNATKLDGHVSGNRIHDIGNTGGYATNSGNTGYGGNGGDAKAVAHSGKAVANGGDGGYSKASGGDGGKGSIEQDAKNGYARNSEKGDGKAFQAAKAEAEAIAKGADGGKGGKSGDATGGDGGAGGTASSGSATVKRTYGGDGGDGGAIRVRGGDAGKFDASNTIRGSFNHAGGIFFPMQNTGASSLQQVGVTTMVNIGSLPSGSMAAR